MGETAVYPRELKERRKPDGKAPFRDHSTGSDERGASTSATDVQRSLLSPPNILKNKKALSQIW